MTRFVPIKGRIEQSAAFLNFLDCNNILNSDFTCSKEDLRQVYNEQFKTEWKTQHGGPVINFSCSMYWLKVKGKIWIYESGEVSLRTTKRTSGPIEQVHQRPGATQNGGIRACLGRISVDQHIIIRGDARVSKSHFLPPAAEPDLPQGIVKRDGAYDCEMCDVAGQTWMNINTHLDGNKHRVQKLLFGLKKYR